MSRAWLIALVTSAAVVCGCGASGASAETLRSTLLTQAAVTQAQPSQQEFDDFLLAVARDVNAVWAAAFRARHVRYRSPRLFIVHPDQRITDPCDDRPVPGTLQNAFWCGVDDNVYLFSQFLLRVVFAKSQQFGVAYVVAHEWGHHIQGQLGYFRRGGLFERRRIPTIQIETQADCYAGLWARSAFDRGFVSQQDVAEVIAATDLVGDQQGTPARVPGAHGQSGLRAAWFLNGFRGGRLRDCRTF